MLMVYVSHPWGGKRGNEINADEETTKLQLDYEDVVFVSPIHAIRTGGYNKVDYVDGLAYAIELMRRCDIVYVAPGWRESTGCRAEVEEARRKNIPIVRTLKRIQDAGTAHTKKTKKRLPNRQGLFSPYICII